MTLKTLHVSLLTVHQPTPNHNPSCYMSLDIKCHHCMYIYKHTTSPPPRPSFSIFIIKKKNNTQNKFQSFNIPHLSKSNFDHLGDPNSHLRMNHFPESNETSFQKNSFDSDEVKKAQYSSQVQSSSSSSFVVDIESFPTRLSEKEHNKTPASRIIRNFSRKGSIRCGDNLANLSQNGVESPRGSPCNSKTPMAVVAIENHVGSDHHHHVTITATDPETRLNPRRLSSGIRRVKPVFSIDPRKVLFVFATLSSLGSLILIYFTLAIKKMNGEAVH